MRLFSVLIFACIAFELCHATSNNLRPCSSDDQVNVQGTEAWFMDRCILYVPYNTCKEALEIFTSVWNGSNPYYNDTNPPNYAQFINFFDWKQDMKDYGLSPIFYSGSGQCPDIVHRLTNVTNITLITLEDQNGPYSVANAAWCNAPYFNATIGSCANETVWGRVPNYNGNYSGYQGASFWGPASEHFGDSAYGTVWALLRSYQTPTYSVPCFPNGIFRGEELPSVMTQPEVTGFRVLLVSNTGQPEETCGSGTVAQIQAMVKSAWNDTRCIVDAPCLLNFICDPDLAEQFESVIITNRDIKCEYYQSYKEKYGYLADINCNCSTDSITKGEKEFTSSDSFCPSVPVKQSEDNPLPTWAIVVIVIGCLVVVSVVIGVIIIVKRGKKSEYEPIQGR